MTTDAIRSTAEQADVVIGTSGAMGTVTLDRPRALNALTEDMRLRISNAFPEFARDPNVYAVVIRSALAGIFSANEDLHDLATLARADAEAAKRVIRGKYALHWLLECFSKPTVSLINGLVMGSGGGLTIFGTHRVAGESYEFATRETAAGFFPDGGLASVFARMPGHVGMYLGLTGRRIGRADAFALNLVTHCISATRFGEIAAGLTEADPVDPLLDERHEDPGRGELARRRDLIESCFSASTVAEVFARLQARSQRGGDDGMWCAAVLDDLRDRSPLALKVTFWHIRESAGRDLRQTLLMDYRLGCSLMQNADFRDSAKAVRDDKDNTRIWSPDCLETIDEAMVQKCFALSPGDEFNLPTRQDMQAARV